MKKGRFPAWEAGLSDDVMIHKIRVEIIRFTDDSQPGFVECRLIDASQREWIFEEKIPAVTEEYLDQNSAYPKQGVIACRCLEKKFIGEREIIRIDTSQPWNINSICGETQFDVFPEQLETKE